MLFNPPTSVSVSLPPLNGLPSRSVNFFFDTIVGRPFFENAVLKSKTSLNFFMHNAQNSQAHFKNLTANTTGFLKCI